MLQWIEALAVWIALAIMRWLGPVAASNLGGAIARRLGPVLPVSRVADSNLRLAMPELDAAARRTVIRGVWDNLGRTAAELPHVAKLEETTAGPGWELDGADTMRAIVAQGGPVLFFSAHLANWEMLPLVAAAYGLPLAGLYRPASNRAVDTLLQKVRQGGVAAPLFPKGSAGARGVLAYLRQGGAVGMLVDQKMNDGIEARFFGQPAMTASALAALALRFRCPVVPAHVQRLGPARFRLVCETPLQVPKDRGALQVATLTQAINDRIELWIRARPESWLWLHRRWPKAINPG